MKSSHNIYRGAEWRYSEAKENRRSLVMERVVCGWFEHTWFASVLSDKRLYCLAYLK